MLKATVGARAYRDYAGMLSLLKPLPDKAAMMQLAVDVLWNGLGNRGVSWIGFYSKAADRDEMLLQARRDKPACSPIGLHGVCGQTLLKKKVMIVRDVADLGANYVACDPRDRAEVAIPLIDDAGACWGVFDVDSWEVGAFDQRDADGFASVLRAAGLQPLAA